MKFDGWKNNFLTELLKPSYEKPNRINIPTRSPSCHVQTASGLNHRSKRKFYFNDLVQNSWCFNMLLFLAPMFWRLLLRDKIHYSTYFGTLTHHRFISQRHSRNQAQRVWFLVAYSFRSRIWVTKKLKTKTKSSPNTYPCILICIPST